MSSPTRMSAPKRRKRLAPDVRKQLILDAALVEFSTHGFAGASTANIARRAGLSSQAGLYVHFKSKDELLLSLFDEILIPVTAKQQDGEKATYEDLEGWIDASYALVANPKMQAVIRIMIIEGARLPRLIEQWFRNVVRPNVAQRQELADTLASRGKIRSNALTQQTLLLLSPVTSALFLHLMLGEKSVCLSEEISMLRQAHKDMLRELVAMPSSGKAP